MRMSKKPWSGLGAPITKKEYLANKNNRKRSLSIQFPDSEKLENGKSRFFKQDGLLVQRGA